MVCTSVREYVFLRFLFKIQKTRLLRFLEMKCQKSRKRYQIFTRKSIKSLAYTVRSETTNIFLLIHTTLYRVVD